MKRIYIFDSTLRDGEQAPGFSMTIKEKVRMARQLEALGADVIEAGFAVSSPGDYSGIQAVAKEIRQATVASLARLVRQDIDYAWNAVREAVHPRLHVFIATSELHMREKLHVTREELLAQVRDLVAYAVSLCPEVEFSAEDATRTDPDFLEKVFIEARAAGASVLNIPDTVGYATPAEIYELVKRLRRRPELKDVRLSIHCHNDLGLAVANSLSAVSAGIDQIECAVNGIGERAGNAALEEIVMNLRTRSAFYQADTGVETTQIMKTSKLLSMLTGVRVQPNKAITGENAFAHEAGIHQHGILQNRETYEIMDPASVGLSEDKIILGKHSGRHAFEDKLAGMGYQLPQEKRNVLFDQFKRLADRKKTVSDKDLEALLKNTMQDIPEVYRLDQYFINSGNVLSSTCSIRILKEGSAPLEGYAKGAGPIEAAFNAINNATDCQAVLDEYRIEAVTGGIDAQGAVSVRLCCLDRTFKGYGVDQNIFEASIKAYINAINNMEYQLNQKEAL